MFLEIINWINKELNAVSTTPLFKKYFIEKEIVNDEDTLYLLNRDEGIGITMPFNQVIDTVQFYSEGKDGCSMFKGELPFGLQFSFTRDEVIAVVGKPKKSGGGKTILYLGHIPCWDKYFFDSYTLHLQYADDNKSIELITLASLRLEEYFNSSL